MVLDQWINVYLHYRLYYLKMLLYIKYKLVKLIPYLFNDLIFDKSLSLIFCHFKLIFRLD